MTFVRRRGAARRAVAAAASALLAAGTLMTATPASAAPSEEVAPRPGGATATLDGLRTYGQAVVREGGETRRTGAGLFQMAVDGGGTFQTYSVDLDAPTQEEARYEETPAKVSPLHANRYAGKIRWIVQHSYPQVNDLEKLAKQAGVRQLTPRAAATGTQVAIWRYSDRPSQRAHTGQAGGGSGPLKVEALDPAAEKLADHLVKAAGSAPEPGPALSLERTGVSGKNGGRLGPVTVHTREREVTVAPGPDAAAKGVRIVSRDGKPVKTARDGSKLYFAVPKGAAPGSTSLSVQAATKMPVGRLLASAAGDVRSPAQIIAGSSWSTVTATADAHWGTRGPIPVATAEKDCSKGVVTTTVHNGGDRPFAFTLAGRKHRVAPRSTTTVPVPVQEDQPYRIAVSGPDGYERTFSGVLDCATVSATQSAPEQRSGSGGAVPQLTRPATVGGAGHSSSGSSVDLAQTGSSDSTPTIIGIAIGLVVVGGVAVLMVRRRDHVPEAAPEGAAEGGEGRPTR